MADTDLLKALAAVQDRLDTMKDETSFVDFDLLNEEIYGQFEPFGMMGKDQVIGLRLMPPGGRKKTMFGIENRKLVELDVVRPGRFIGYIKPNAPHHLDKMYGWWHLNGTEEFYIPINLNNGHSCLLLLEANPKDRVDTFAWYCPNCFNHLYSHTTAVGVHGLEGYWKDEAKAIANFNSDKKLRTCRECGTVHQEAYSVFDPLDKKVW